MNPMDFFNKKDGFPFNAMPQSEINPKSILEMKKMVKQYHSLLNDDFWGDIHGLRTSKKKQTQMIPVEIWEDVKHIYLCIVAPGLPSMKYAKIHFNTDQILTLKVKSHSLKPSQAVTLLSSDLPQQYYEREIPLPKSVKMSNYTSSYEDGVLTYTFIKEDNELEIPFDF
ncbi:Hsp20 family protein [Litchfieldia alkalitelluris]|uniref:Hsp20 family protein n=1 Tax=Litchfieldia alkalitelluris TaxID=304268 RepID=UPI0009964C8E|nr:Hsp20 family protein [Litchfieldia alkalitelluris]